ASNGIRRGQGRPSRLYSISSEGDKLFPRTYEELAQALLDDIQALGGAQTVDQIFEHRRKRLLEQYRARMAGRDFREKVATLAKARDEEGYVAEQTQLDRDRFVLIEHNCPIRAVAEAHRATCRCAIALFQEALGAEVVRTEPMLDGSPDVGALIPRPRRTA